MRPLRPFSDLSNPAVEGSSSDEQAPPLTLEQATQILLQLKDVIDDKHIVLVGGQAVAVWANQLADRINLLPEQVTSRDIDFLGGPGDIRRAADLLHAKLTLSRGWSDRANPLAGVATFVDSDSHERRLDFLQRVYGLRADDIRKTAIPLQITVGDATFGLWVLHPERCLESRVKNCELANKQTELAYRQLKASIECAHAFNELLLDEAGTEGVEAVQKLSERIFRLAMTPIGLRLYRERGIDIAEAVVEDDRLDAMYLSRRLPQLRRRLENARTV